MIREYAKDTFDHDFKNVKLEQHADEGLVERAGYMETEDIVRELMEAGERLTAFREAMYPNEDSVPDDDLGDHPMNSLDAMYELKEIRKRNVKERELKRFEEEQKKEKEVKEEAKEKEEEKQEVLIEKEEIK